MVEKGGSSSNVQIAKPWSRRGIHCAVTSLEVNNSILKPKTKSERATVGFLTLFTGVDNANFSFDAFFCYEGMR